MMVSVVYYRPGFQVLPKEAQFRSHLCNSICFRAWTYDTVIIG